jgi:SAM-dependent methyltransferase
MSLEHWESYYREGAAVSCPLGLEPGYTKEVRDSWVEFFSALAAGSRVVDIGTGNAPVAVIAADVSRELGLALEIHAVDLAQVDPARYLKGGAERLAGVHVHAGVAAESLPFEPATVDAVSGQFALEHMDRAKVLAEVARVLRPGGRAQFILQHRDSIIVQNAEESLRLAAVVLDETKVFRKLMRYLEAERNAPRAAIAAWQDIVADGQRLQQEAERARSSMLLTGTLDFLRQLFDRRHRLDLAELERQVGGMESDMRASVRRLHDIAGAALSADDVGELVRTAEAAGFTDIHYQAQLFDLEHLVGWRLRMSRA